MPNLKTLDDNTIEGDANNRGVIRDSRLYPKISTRDSDQVSVKLSDKKCFRKKNSSTSIRPKDEAWN